MPGEEETASASRSADNTFKILVATDNHLGYAEKHPVRGQDTFVTFEEILQLAVKNQVDFILLGGDLFHDSKPSPYCTHKCIELLRKYCLNDNSVSFEFLSDQSYNFLRSTVPVVNYEDPNLNVGFPVFSIHGNHDDPTGHKQISALDVVASTGLINYFGRWNDLSQVDIRPILLQKGQTRLALYGLSHIRDERLGRLFRDKKVQMLKPSGDDWFNLFVLHQNRAARGVKNFIPDNALPNFLHLVIWGHEHDCRIEPEQIGNDVFISQPGSSVATSLAVGESIPKKVALLYINKQEFKITPIPLKTVRPFLIDELILENPASDEYHVENPANQAIAQVKDKIESMIKQAASKNLDLDKPSPMPLLRLKVFYHTDHQQFNAIRIGMLFADRVANHDDVIKLAPMVNKGRRPKGNDSLDQDDSEAFINVNEWATSVEDVILKCFQENESQLDMRVLSAKGMTEAVTSCVKYNNDEAIELVIKNQMNKTLKQLEEMDVDVDNIEEAIKSVQENRLENVVQRETSVPSSVPMQIKQTESTTFTARTPRRRRMRAPRAKCGRNPLPVAVNDVIAISDDDDDDNDDDNGAEPESMTVATVPAIKRSQEELKRHVPIEDDIQTTRSRRAAAIATTNLVMERHRARGGGGRAPRARARNAAYSTLDSFLFD